MERRQIARYGWRPSLPDARDLIADTAQLRVLAEVDPRPEMPPVYDQGQLGSCTANAVAACIEYDCILSQRDIGGTPSRLDIYYGERAIEGSPANADVGAYGRDGFKYARRVGTIPETSWPYDISKFANKPPDDTKHRHKIAVYKAVPRSMVQFKRVLSNRQTIAFGFTVYDSFETREVAETGVVPMPGPRESILGGHEVLLCGYLAKYPFHGLIRNSWNADWGLGGYALFPWAYLLDANLASDFRTLVRPAGK